MLRYRNWGGGLLLVAVLTALLLAALVRPLAAAEADTKASARLVTVDGARVLVLRGGPYARGYEYGRLLADDIKLALNRYLRVGMVEHWQVPWQRLTAGAAKMEPFIPEEAKQEMRGIAAGAGVPYEDILVLNTHVDTVAHGPENAPRGNTAECSGVAVMRHWTSDGRVLHGHNVDWTNEEDIQKAAVLLVIIPEDGVPFCMPTHAGLVCCNAGMNAAGITYSDMTSLSADQRLNAMPLMIMARMLLQKARTLDQALALLREWPDTCGWNMLVTDAKGPDMRAIEISASHLAVFGPGDFAENTPTGAPITEAIVRTNHFVDRAMFALACERFRVSPAQGIVQAIADSSYQRYVALENRIRADRRPVEPADIQTWLREPPVGSDGNIQSMVFDPARQELWIANSAADGTPACNTRFSHVDLKPYFVK